MKKSFFLLLSCIVAQGTVNAMERLYPLHDAIAQGSLDQVNVLLNRGVDVNEAKPNCTAPLHAAISMGHEDIALLLLERGANVNTQDINGSTPLHQAVMHCHPPVVKRLLDHGASVHFQEGCGRTPLHLTAMYGCLDNVQLLLEHGADVYVVDCDGQSPLLRAADNRNAVAIEQLINDHIERSFHHTPDSAAPSVANISQPEQQKTNVFVTKSGHLTVERRPMTATSVPPSTTVQVQPVAAASTVMVNACYSGPHAEAVEKATLERLKTSLETGFDVNQQDCQGRTKLHEAAHYGHKQVVQFLLDHGARVDMPDNEGRTPLHWAARNSHQEIVQLLLNHGATVNWQNRIGATPLHFASICSHPKIIQLLLNCGAKVNTPDNEGMTPLHWAAENGHLAAAQLLLNYGAGVNLQNCLGATPLHFTCFLGGYPAVAKLLLDHGADVNLVVRAGHTPLQTAVTMSSPEVAQLIKDYIARAKSMAICPQCLSTIIEVAAAEHAQTPCCHNFICRECLTLVKAHDHKCPLCRRIEGW